MTMQLKEAGLQPTNEFWLGNATGRRVRLPTLDPHVPDLAKRWPMRVVDKRKKALSFPGRAVGLAPAGPHREASPVEAPVHRIGAGCGSW